MRYKKGKIEKISHIFIVYKYLEIYILDVCVCENERHRQTMRENMKENRE